MSEPLTFGQIRTVLYGEDGGDRAHRVRVTVEVPVDYYEGISVKGHDPDVAPAGAVNVSIPLPNPTLTVERVGPPEPTEYGSTVVDAKGLVWQRDTCCRTGAWCHHGPTGNRHGVHWADLDDPRPAVRGRW